MRVESPRQLDPKRFFRIAAAGTVLSIAAMSGGIFGWARQLHNPVNQECGLRIARLNDLQRDLIKSGTLSRNPIPVYEPIVLVNSSDPRVGNWEQLKNEKDKACDNASEFNSKPINVLSRVGALGGAVVTLVGVSTMANQRKRIQEESIKLSRATLS